MTTAVNPIQPDYGTQMGTDYPDAIDASFAAMWDFGTMFYGHESTPQAMSVDVEAGEVYVLATKTVVQKSLQTVTIAANSSGAGRIDRVVVDRTTGVASVIQGTPGATPVAPAFTSTSQMPCAQVAVANGASSIVDANITTERNYMQAGQGDAAAYPVGEASGSLITWESTRWNKTTVSVQSASYQVVPTDRGNIIKMTGNSQTISLNPTTSGTQALGVGFLIGVAQDTAARATTISLTNGGVFRLPGRVNVTGSFTLGQTSQVVWIETDGTNANVVATNIDDTPSLPNDSSPVLGNYYIEAFNTSDGLMHKLQATLLGVADGSVSQAKLKTTNGSVSLTGNGSAVVASNATLPGGAYGFYPQMMGNTANDGVSTASWDILSIGPNTTIGSFTTYIRLLGVGDPGGKSVTPFSGTLYAQQQYVEACPPYDLGEGEILLFVFLLVEKGSGKIFSTYSASTPPWMYNGKHAQHRQAHVIDEKGRAFRYTKPSLMKPTPRGRASLEKHLDGIKTEKMQFIEITQDMKNAEMASIPHPFIDFNKNRWEVVMLDPLGKLMERLAPLHDIGSDYSASNLLHDGSLVIDNEPLKRKGPPGVKIVRAKLK